VWGLACTEERSIPKGTGFGMNGTGFGMNGTGFGMNGTGFNTNITTSASTGLY
jgi:hypothetical protein